MAVNIAQTSVDCKVAEYARFMENLKQAATVLNTELPGLFVSIREDGTVKIDQGKHHL